MTTRYTTLDLLRQTRAHLTLPRRWTQGVIARDRQGNPVFATDPDAASFSLDGALLRVAELTEAWNAHEPALRLLGRACGGSVREFNDHPEMSHLGALVVLDEAIGHLEGRADG